MSNFLEFESTCEGTKFSGTNVWGFRDCFYDELQSMFEVSDVDAQDI